MQQAKGTAWEACHYRRRAPAGVLGQRRSKCRSAAVGGVSVGLSFPVSIRCPLNNKNMTRGTDSGCRKPSSKMSYRDQARMPANASPPVLGEPASSLLKDSAAPDVESLKGQVQA